MNNLSIYALAMNSYNTDLLIINDISHSYKYHENGVVVQTDERIVTFSNLVTIKVQHEFDQLDTVIDGICPECWITYEIISNPENVQITPVKKTFISRCQEAFWLKLNVIRAENN